VDQDEVEIAITPFAIEIGVELDDSAFPSDVAVYVSWLTQVDGIRLNAGETVSCGSEM
jgi:hypothetical protein